MVTSAEDWFQFFPKVTSATFKNWFLIFKLIFYRY